MVRGVLALHSVYPQAKLLFMYRDGLKCAQSVTKGREEDVIVKLIDQLTFHFPQLQKHFFKACGFSASGFIPVRSGLARYFMVWAVLCAKYKDLRNEGIPIVAVRYEDMLANPQYATRVILEYTGLDQDLTRRALKAFGRDSQRDTPFNQRRISRHKPDEVTASSRKELDAVCLKTGVPKIPETLILDGTITSMAVKDG